MSRRLILFLLGSMCVCGCATVQGPVISKREVTEATKDMEVRAFEFNRQQVMRINRIGYELIRHIPKEDIKSSPGPYLGLFVLPRNRITNRMFDSKPEDGVYIGFVLEDTPIAKAGISPGDIVLAINGKEIRNIDDIIKMVKKAMKEEGTKNRDEITLTLWRDEARQDVRVLAEELPVNVSFYLLDEEIVNAFASSDRIWLTYGMANFCKTDHELASVVGHELAHVARGHMNRKGAAHIVNVLASVTLGVTAEVFVPGAGDLVQAGTEALGNMAGLRFSRDLEREADFFGTKFIYLSGYDAAAASNFSERLSIEVPATLSAGYLNTHPGSPERTVRLRKIAEELKSGAQAGSSLELSDSEKN